MCTNYDHDIRMRPNSWLDWFHFISYHVISCHIKYGIEQSKVLVSIFWTFRAGKPIPHSQLFGDYLFGGITILYKLESISGHFDPSNPRATTIPKSGVGQKGKAILDLKSWRGTSHTVKMLQKSHSQPPVGCNKNPMDTGISTYPS